MLRLIIIVSILLKSSFLFAEGINVIKPNNFSDIDSSIICQGCHDRIYDEWSNSMHANSIPSRDPIVGAFYKYLSENKVDTRKCDKCHSPVLSLYPDEEKNEAAGIFEEGITCVFCHSVYEKASDRNQVYGTNYFQLNFVNGFTGPTNIRHQTKYHETRYAPIFRTVEFCVGCHQEGEGDFSLKGKTNLLCQTCHMPSQQNEKSATTSQEREVVYRHSFMGGHSEPFLGKTAKVSGEAERRDRKTTVNIYVANSTTHTIPTGYPLREMYLKVTGFNEKNEVVWSNFKKDPYGEDPQSYLGLVLPKGEEALAHYVKDVKPVKDLRLGPRGTRLLSYEIASDKINVIKVKLIYRLLSRTVTQKLKIEESLVPEISVLEETMLVKQ